MSRHRLLIGLAILLAIVTAGLFKLYFIGTSEALRHAETFLFRRMSVTQLSEHGLYRFFYATNRQTEDPSAPPPARFSTLRSDTITYGAFDAQIQPSLGLGMLINPTQWLQNEEISLLDVHTTERQPFIDALRKAVDDSPHQAVLVVLHGYREAHESALRKTAFLGHVLDIDAPVLLFDWPGNQGSSLRGYRRAHRIASDSGNELAQLLTLLVNDVRPRQLWLMANSMGAQVVVEAFHQLYQKADFSDVDIEFGHVILTAPDVSSSEFDERFREEIDAMADHTTVYVSSNDRALLASRFINRAARLGESSLDPQQLDEASRIYSLTAGGNEQLSLVDVTPVNRTRNFHNFSLETPEVFDDIFLRLSNPEMPASRPIYKISAPDGATYHVLTRGR